MNRVGQTQIRPKTQEIENAPKRAHQTDTGLSNYKYSSLGSGRSSTVHRLAVPFTNKQPHSSFEKVIDERFLASGGASSLLARCVRLPLT